jgi:hypothetical protein
MKSVGRKLASGTGSVGAKPVVVGPSWLLPARVGLDGDDLVWVPASEGRRARGAQPTATLLEQFIALEEAPAAATVDFPESGRPAKPTIATIPNAVIPLIQSPIRSERGTSAEDTVIDLIRRMRTNLRKRRIIPTAVMIETTNAVARAR